MIDIVYMENERDIRKVLEEKWKNHNHMVQKMVDIVKKYGLSNANIEERLERKMGVKTEGSNWTAVHDDCVEDKKKNFNVQSEYN
ncbi:dNA methylase family protein [Clostridium sp. CAG:632]|nr:dNA methylase family protein [Clostridium sp. CAG:632]